jgi:hypothetical protein
MENGMTIIASIEARIKEYETAIAQSLANHNGLLGALNELKTLLGMATKVVEVVDPALAPALNVANEVVNTVDGAVQSVESEQSVASEQPS